MGVSIVAGVVSALCAVASLALSVYDRVREKYRPRHPLILAMLFPTRKGIIMKFSVCVGNYGYYAEGELRDAWIDLPASPERIAAFLRNNGLQDAEHEEIYISDYECPEWARSAVENAHSLAQLDALARLCEAAKEWELDALQGAFDCGADWPATVLELCNLVLQADEIPFNDFGGQTPGEYFAGAFCVIDELERAVGDLACYFDFEAYGRDCLIDYLSTDYGYLSDDMPEFDAYDWEDIYELAGIPTPAECPAAA